MNIIEMTDKEGQNLTAIEIPCDTLIMAIGAKPYNGLYDQLNRRELGFIIWEFRIK